MITKEIDTVAEIVEIAINSDNPEIFASVCGLLIDGLVILANTSSDEDHKERFVKLVVKHMRDGLEITQKTIKQF
jgi:hypothetical protein